MTTRRRAAAGMFLLLTVVGAACSSGPDDPSAPHPALAAVRSWLTHVATDDDAAYTDLAPRSRAAVGDLANYRRGSGRFVPVYERYAGTALDEPVRLDAGVVVVTLRDEDAVAAVPVRLVDGIWLVDPLLDVGSFSHRPDDGTEVGARPTVTLQLDDPRTTATVWLDGEQAEPDAAGTNFRPTKALRRGTSVVTIALERGDDVVARAFRIQVG